MTRLPLFLALAVLGVSACRDDGLSDPIHPVPSPTVTPTPTPGVTPTPTPGVTPTPTPNDSDTSGAIMVSANEAVSVISVDSTTVTGSVLTIARSNGEIWEFDLPGIPGVTIGTIVTYRNTSLIFGSTLGIIIYADGSTSDITASSRIQ